MNKKWIKGAVLIAIGALVSFLLCFLIISEDIYMLNPKYRGFILIGIPIMPAFIYGTGYALWYRKCVIQKSGPRGIDKNTVPKMLAFIVLVFATLLLIFDTARLRQEAPGYFIISGIIPTIFFSWAFLSLTAEINEMQGGSEENAGAWEMQEV